MRSAFCNVRTLLLAFGFAAATAVAGPAAAAPAEPKVDVEVADGEIRANVSMFVRAPREQVWDVISDFERAPEYIRNLEISNIVSRSGDTLRVFQKDHFKFGPFKFGVDTLSDVKLVEHARIESRLVSGSLKKYDAVTELVSEPGGTRIIYRSFAIPGSALAFLAGESFVKRETEDRFRQIRNEILRRQHLVQK